MGMINCPKFKSCGAPICPLSKRATNKGVWYANEPICSRMDLREKFRWINIQRKIKRKVKKYPHNAGLFTVEMLLRIQKVGKKIQGIKDAARNKTLYKTWMKVHPLIIELTDEQKKARAKRYTKLAEAGSKNLVWRNLKRF